jgi:transcriptional regulator with XRE-family HTH domain
MSSALVNALSNRLGVASQPRPRSILANGNEALLKSYKLQKGLYARVAKSLGVDPSYVSRVANGERHSDRVNRAMLRELVRASAPYGSHPQCPICHDSQLTVLDTKLKIPVAGTRAKNGHAKDMAAYRCAGQHIFFVRSADLLAPKRRQHAAA